MNTVLCDVICCVRDHVHTLCILRYVMSSVVYVTMCMQREYCVM